jgi:alpha-1,2-mannosyltransferase
MTPSPAHNGSHVASHDASDDASQVASQIASRDASRPDAVYARFTFAFGVIFLCVAAVYFFSAQSFSFTRPSIDYAGFAVGRDFINNWMGGRSAFSGGPAPWFDFATYNAALQAITGHPDLPPYHWSYPPHLILFIWPLGLLPYLPAYVLWCVAGLALYLFAARAGGVAPRHMLFLAVAPGVLVNVLGGQNGFLTAALLIGGLANLDRRPIFSGVLFGILTIKPQFGLLLPVLLLVTGRWRVIAAAIVTAAVLAAVTAIWFGPDVWLDYVRKVMPYQQQAIIDAGKFGWVAVASPFVDAQRIGISADAAWIIQALASCSAFAMVVWTFWRKRDPVLSLALFVTATFLFTPYIFNYDMVVLGFVAARLRERTDNTLADHVLVLAVWILPLAMLPLGLAGIPIASLVLPALAGRLIWRLRRGEMPASIDTDAAGKAPVVPLPRFVTP